MNYTCPCGEFNGTIEFDPREKSRLVPCPRCYVETFVPPDKPYKAVDGTLMSRDDVLATVGGDESRLKAQVGVLSLTSVGSTLYRTGRLIEISDDGSTSEAREYKNEATHNVTKDKARDVKP